MWTYIFMFLIPSFLALGPDRSDQPKTDKIPYLIQIARWIPLIIALSILVGLRYEVGGDWKNYIRIFNTDATRDIADIIVGPEISFHVLNWISYQFDFGVVGVNFVCAAIFSVCLIEFARLQPLPWLSIAISVPYLVIVVGMGYTRQAVALGIALLALNAATKGRNRSAVLFVIAASTFHRSAFILLPIFGMSSAKNRYITAIWVGIFSIIFAYINSGDAEELYESYVSSQMQSGGALVRLMLNATPAIIFLFMWKRMSFSGAELKIWRWFSIISLILLVLYFIVPASTALDRIALYCLPLQMVVFGRIPFIPAYDGKKDIYNTKKESYFVLAILSTYALIEFIWLNYANNAEFWVPYQTYYFS